MGDDGSVGGEIDRTGAHPGPGQRRAGASHRIVSRANRISLLISHQHHCSLDLRLTITHQHLTAAATLSLAMSTRASNTDRRGRGSSPSIRDSSRPSSAGSLDSQQSSASNKVGDTSYRNISLRSAGVFVNELESEHWPSDRRTFVEHLLAVEDVVGDAVEDVVENAVENSDVSSAMSLVLPEDLQTICATLSRQAISCQAGSQSGWMRLARDMLGLYAHPHIFVHENGRMDVQASPISMNRERLSTPTPDLVFGLAVLESQDLPSPAPALSEEVLVRLISLCGIQPFPVQAERAIAFPCVVFEAKSDSATLLAAEYQAAHAAAKALSMLETLKVVAGASCRLPTVVVCSQGSIYELLVSFELHAEELPTVTDPFAGWGRNRRPKSGFHLVEIWTGNVRRAEVMLTFQKIWYRVMRWVLNTWRPTILQMLDAVRATISEEEEDEVM